VAAQDDVIPHVAPFIQTHLIDLQTIKLSEPRAQEWLMQNLGAEAMKEIQVPQNPNALLWDLGEVWRSKEASTLAFGCILDGPNRERMQPLVHEALPKLMTLMTEPYQKYANYGEQHALVKDTAAWTIGRICHLMPEYVADRLEELMQTLAQGLQDVPKVACNVCWVRRCLCVCMASCNV
jgi:hypothetical protein